jgi:hypothetical protein
MQKNGSYQFVIITPSLLSLSLLRLVVLALAS